jgi:hypothetical protein
MAQPEVVAKSMRTETGPGAQACRNAKPLSALKKIHLSTETDQLYHYGYLEI